MVDDFEGIAAVDRERIAPFLVRRALTAGSLVYEDGATQVFSSDGMTTYVEDGRVSAGEWTVDETGRFASFWPPHYTAEYDLRWLVEDGRIVGLRFLGRDSVPFVGRYRTGE
ncbi:hypothetical protein ACFQO6_07555 [Nocardioides astragali]|uniref:Nuclear transport factor 2 family protein n=1 Tax=Nocardioides astragali TaxID=1776736 RepID=A0ABW2N2M8_9ACTN